MSLSDEMDAVPHLSNTGRALVDFTMALCPGGAFEQTRCDWVYCPKKFVVFTIHPRAGSITLSLRGNPGEFGAPQYPVLKKGMPSYSRYVVTDARQLAEAARFIERAWVIYGRGRTRQRLKPVITEVPI